MARLKRKTRDAWTEVCNNPYSCVMVRAWLRECERRLDRQKPLRLKIKCNRHSKRKNS